MEWVNHFHRWYRLLEVNPKRLLQAEGHFERNPQKLASLVEKIRQGGEVDAPIVGRRGEGICFIDGRHRTVAAVMVGLPTIKIAVRPEDIEFIQSFLHESQLRTPYTIFYPDGVARECESIEEMINSVIAHIFDPSIPYHSLT